MNTHADTHGVSSIGADSIVRSNDSIDIHINSGLNSNMYSPRVGTGVTTIGRDKNLLGGSTTIRREPTKGLINEFNPQDLSLLDQHR